MNTNTIEFKLSESEQSRSFAMLIKYLNECGVPYKINTEMQNLQANIEISNGF
jgi:hypothetical protein